MAQVKATYINAVTVDADDTDLNVANLNILRARAQAALTNNQTYLAIATPTQAQAVAQVGSVTRQVDGLIRFLLGAFDSVADS